MLIRTALAITFASLSLSGFLFAGDIDGLKGQGFDLDGQSFFIVGITTTGDGVGIRAFTVIPATAKGTVESRRWNSTEEALEFLRSQRREVAANRFNSIDANGVQLVYDPSRQALVSPQTAAANQRRAQQAAADEIERTLQALRAKQAQAEYQSRLQQARQTASQSNPPSGSRTPGYSPSVPRQPLGWPYRDADGMVRIPTAQELDPRTFPPNQGNSMTMDQLSQMMNESHRSHNAYLQSLPLEKRIPLLEQNWKSSREQMRSLDDLARPAR